MADGGASLLAKPCTHAEPLTLVTWLAPSLPLELFEALGSSLAVQLGRDIAVRSVTHVSGPQRLEDDLFCTGEADMGIVCAPCARWLLKDGRRSVRWPALAPLWLGRPTYHSLLLMRPGSTHSRLSDLRGLRWAYNDVASLSGHDCVVDAVRSAFDESAESFFGDCIASGSHVTSLRMLLAGEVDVAAIDSNVLRLQTEVPPEEVALLPRLPLILGPFAAQPMCLSSLLPDCCADAICAAVLALPGIERFGLTGWQQMQEELLAAVPLCSAVGAAATAATSASEAEDGESDSEDKAVSVSKCE